MQEKIFKKYASYQKVEIYNEIIGIVWASASFGLFA